MLLLALVQISPGGYGLYMHVHMEIGAMDLSVDRAP